MNDEQIVKYVRDMITNNLTDKSFFEEAIWVKFDETNKTLLEHINGLIELFTKAKEILEKGDKNE